MLKKSTIMILSFALFSGLLYWPADSVFASSYKKRYFANLKGFQEVPSVSTQARGYFRATLSRDGKSLDYKLSYQNLSNDVRFAHIHFGQRRTNGNVIVFLCDTADFSDPTGLAPECPAAAGGTVEGTLTAANVIGPANQGIEPGEFDELIGALRALAGYVNVHSDAFPPGEIRGQIYGH